MHRTAVTKTTETALTVNEKTRTCHPFQQQLRRTRQKFEYANLQSRRDQQLFVGYFDILRAEFRQSQNQTRREQLHLRTTLPRHLLMNQSRQTLYHQNVKDHHDDQLVLRHLDLPHAIPFLRIGWAGTFTSIQV
jgi:hypothetical protein